MIISVINRVENIGKRRKCRLPVFPFPVMFSKVFILRGVKTRDCMVKGDSLPNDKILDVNKLKAFADDRIKLAQIMISVFDRVENNVGKRENAGYHHFLLFPQCFQRDPFLELLKVRIAW